MQTLYYINPQFFLNFCSIFVYLLFNLYIYIDTIKIITFIYIYNIYFVKYPPFQIINYNKQFSFSKTNVYARDKSKHLKKKKKR